MLFSDIPELDFVMERGEIIGHIMYVRSIIKADDGCEILIMTFGSIGIAPKLQYQGFGRKLLVYSMMKAGGNGRWCTGHYREY